MRTLREGRAGQAELVGHLILRLHYSNCCKASAFSARSAIVSPFHSLPRGYRGRRTGGNRNRCLSRKEAEMSILHTTKAKLGGGLAVDCYPVAVAFCEERAKWLVFAFG